MRYSEELKGTLKIVFIYLIFGLLWITWSDLILTLLIKDPNRYAMIQTYKGWLFIIITGGMLFYLIKTNYDKINLLNDDLNTKEEFIQQMYNDTTTAIVQRNMNGKILRVNKYFTQLTGYVNSEVVGKDCYEIFSIDKSEGKIILEEIVRDSQNKDYETKLTGKNGDAVYIRWNNTVFRNNEATTIMSFGVDITKEKIKEKELEYYAYHDRLTGLGNRYNLEIRLKEMIEKEIPFSLFHIDINHFNELNDIHSHQIGDLLIQKVSKMLRSRFEENDIYRWPGDEMMLISDVVDIFEISEKANEIFRLLNQKWTISQVSINNSVSVGAVIYPEHGRYSTELIRNVDIAINKAKEQDGFRLFDFEIQREIENYVMIKEKLEKAILNDEFIFNFQPIYNIEKQKIVTLEVLLRWYSEEIGDVSPSEFISIAEKTDLIIEIDRWVIKHAFEFIEKNVEKLKDITVAINVSTKTFKSFEFIEYLEKLLKSVAVDPAQIEFEITEYSIIDNINSSLMIMDSLKLLGFKIALDDFGTKYSSLNYLGRLPFDYLKIDKSYVDHVLLDGKQKIIVSQLIQLANKIGIQTIAEGIETKAQEEIIASFGCELGQGYFFSRPVNEKALFNILIKDEMIDESVS